MLDPANKERVLALRINFFEAGILDGHFSREKADHEERLKDVEKGSKQAWAIKSHIQFCEVMESRIANAIKEFVNTPPEGERNV
jgi:hypothetical protein